MTDPQNAFVEKLIAEFHDNAEKGTWRDPKDDSVALFPIENVEAWLRTALLAAVEHGREETSEAIFLLRKVRPYLSDDMPIPEPDLMRKVDDYLASL